jgi:DNA-directed RNA polymerase subunit D
MKVEATEFKGKKGIVKLSDTDVYFLNALRRVMIAELPKLAIDNVIIYDNTSPLFDEIVSHRLGLIPVPTDLRLIIFRDECTCKGKGCPSCTVRYTLSKEEEGVVYSGDLQPETESWSIQEDKIPIVELGKEQRIILEVEAVLGRGRDNAKWQSVQGATYQMKISLEFDQKKIDDVKEFVEGLPKGVVEFKGNKLELIEDIKLPVLQSYLDNYDEDIISITKDPHTFTFSFETDGAIAPKDALKEAIQILENKYKELDKHLTSLK